MKMFPVEYEVYLDDEQTVFGKFKAFDEECMEVTLETQIMSSKDLRDFADCLDKAEELLKNGVSE